MESERVLKCSNSGALIGSVPYRGTNADILEPFRPSVIGGPTWSVQPVELRSPAPGGPQAVPDAEVENWGHNTQLSMPTRLARVAYGVPRSPCVTFTRGGERQPVDDGTCPSSARAPGSDDAGPADLLGALRGGR